MSETEDYDKSATPTAHKTSHQDGGSDEISVTGLAGLLADGQTPLAHKTSHQDAGTDEISVAGLSGTLADDQHIIDSEAVSAMGTKANSNPLNHDRYADSEALAAAVQAGAITDGVTKAPTHDAVYDVAVLLLDHSARHENDGLDEISVAGLSGELTDLQKPKDHTHQSAGSGVGGKLDHGLALDGLADDDHTQYIKHALATAESDFLAASGAGAFVKKTLAETKTILGIAAGGDQGEGHITVLPYSYSAIIQGTWVIYTAATQILYSALYNSTIAQNDQLDFKIYLAAGTYTFRVAALRDNNRGILSLLFDTVSQGTVDLYNAGSESNFFGDITGIVVATPGLKTVSLKAATKNTNSNGYMLCITYFVLFRTA